MSQHIEIINNWNLKKVFDELENGNFKIPKFQRGYVWERSKIVKLLNSIYKQFPIGSFFIWVASKEYKDFCREIEELNLPKEPQAHVYSFILDGQQRITSLFVALKGKILNKTDYSSICFNLDKKIFQIPRLKNERHNVPAWKLFSTIDYGDIYKQYTIYDIENQTSLADSWRECQQIFTEYPISLIKTLKMEIDEVVEIFERINQGGKKLSLFDLVHASAWSPVFDLREKINQFNEEKNVAAFGGLDYETFTQSLALNVFGDPRNQYQLKLTAENCASQWTRTTESLKLTIDFLKEFGVKYSSFIPYNSFVPILQYYFFKSNAKSVSVNHRSLIEDWFWTATFSQRFSSSSLSKMKDDGEWIVKLLKGENVENKFIVTIAGKELKKVRMQNKSVIKSGILCLMALQNPKDIDNGQLVVLDKSNVSRANSKENHHFFPYSLRTRFDATVDQINSILNFAFISGRLNREISNKLPSVYTKTYAVKNGDINTHLASHFINSEALKAILNDDFAAFIDARSQEIIKKIADVTKTSVSQHDIEVNDEVEVEEEIESENI